jgi:hypothetical protein
MSLAVTTSPIAYADVRAARERQIQMRDADRLKAMKAAVETLRSQPVDRAAERKAAARQKVEQIRERIRLLAMTASGDPKATARQVAQLARELGQAVRAHAAAGGTASVGSAPSPQAPPASDAAAVTAEPVASSSGTETIATEADPQTASSDREPAQPVAGTHPYDKSLASLNDQAREMDRLRAAQDAEGREDKDFMDLVRDLARKLKDILRESRLKDPQRRDPELDEKADAAIKTMDAEIGAAGSGLNTFTGASVSA